MFKRNLIFSAVLLATSAASAQVEVSGKYTHESANYTEQGTNIGDTISHNQDGFKRENSVRVYFDGELDNSVLPLGSFHVEVQGFMDESAIEAYTGNEPYTQRDTLREAYVDTQYNDWAIRAGKQQVVWGTADGAKFLDIINPTDYTEMAQNQMEDSRIPVWMMNAEKPLEDGGSFQVIVSQSRENVFAGLNRNIDQGVRSNGALSGNGAMALAYGGDVISPGHDKGHSFILKGVDTISGEDNGFINIAPDLGTVASLFGRAFALRNDSDEGGLNLNSHSNAPMAFFSVGSFNQSGTIAELSNSLNNNFTGYGFDALNFGGTAFWNTDANGCYNAAGTDGDSGTNHLDQHCTYDKSSEGQFYTGQQALAGFAGMFGTTLHDMDKSTTNTTFELMDRTPFATFDAFVGATSQYIYDMPSDASADLAMRYKNTTPNGTNYSFNYSYAYDKNPVIDVSWRDQAGNRLSTKRINTAGVVGEYSTGTEMTSVLELVGGSNPDGYGGLAIANGAGESAVLTFEQTLERAHNLGASFDTTIDTAIGPVVLRGEGLYQKDVYQPVIDRGALSIGDLPAALTMRKGDKFKYVIGADMTAMTNMMVSLQFIQERNLDYIDSNVDFDGSSECTADRVGTTANCGVYTLDFASMHLSNGLQKAEEAKDFVSVFLSKPFGESGQHRWNNILMLEENGGRWNRFDMEYTVNDNTVAIAEYNKYWGSENTQFGQLDKSSNIQVGLKYTF